jgi:fatty acid desaturase
MLENHLAFYNQTLRQYLSKEEISELMEKSDWQGWLEIATTWGWITFVFLLSAIFPNPISFIISLFVLGGKQLGCAIIMHDCSHDSVFKTRWLNTFVGNWLGAYPLFQNLEQYKPYHREHHLYTGLEHDPDLPLVKGYPTYRASMYRKFLRDFSGVTGVKGHFALLVMHLGIIKYNLAGTIVKLKEKWTTERIKIALSNLRGPFMFYVIFVLFFVLIGKPWLLLLWFGALLTTHQFSLRVRSIAEHSLVPEQQNPFQNSRTTYANFIEKILFAPHHVNFHSEHHLCMGIPSYNFHRMHQLLKERGYYTHATLENGYWPTIKRAGFETVAKLKS